ncbi:MAG TPA: DUF2726 domain-containing protein [Anaerolineae bacterium]|nr:DUF2726 domain-containing protein [Anaerolineae bacterium]
MIPSFVVVPNRTHQEVFLGWLRFDTGGEMFQMWQRLRRFLEHLNEYRIRLWKWIIGAQPDVIPGTPPGPPKIEKPTARPGLGEPEMGLAAPGEPPQYRRRESLFTYRERVFYRALMEDIGSEYQVFAKVRLGDFVYLANEPTDRKYHLNQIQCKHVDFLLCDNKSQQPLLAIELDDSSHTKYDHRESDEFKKDLFNKVGLKLLRVQVRQKYPKGEIGSQVRSSMQEA